VKINRTKLNTLLRSGLNPEIKTRKQLATHLGLDSTSLTRWFANFDRLGNPRYPVVPDRHIANILRIFKLEPQCLSLTDDEFHQYCFETAAQRQDDSNDVQKKQLARLERIAQRRLTVPGSPKKKKYTTLSLPIVAVLAISAAVWLLFKNYDPEQSMSLSDNLVSGEVDCWTGYSPTLGTFDEEDASDPCHYRKLLHNALTQLKASNESELLLSPTALGTNTKDYVMFLSNSVDQLRILEKSSLNIELGRSELRQLNYPAALMYFTSAAKVLASSSEPSTELVADLSAFAAVAAYSDKPWGDARQSYERLLPEDPIWKNRWANAAQAAQIGEKWRNSAMSELESGNLVLAQSHIKAALQEDTRNLGKRHFSMASNWLLMSHILALQTALPTARTFAQQAIDLDIRLFGEQHPRVVQDRMILMFIALQEGSFTEAYDHYQLVSNLFRKSMFFDPNVSQMDHWLQKGLKQLKDASLLLDEEAKMHLGKEGWNYLNKAITFSNPFMPQKATLLISKDIKN
jgi:hypothetical protein